MGPILRRLSLSVVGLPGRLRGLLPHLLQPGVPIGHDRHGLLPGRERFALDQDLAPKEVVSFRQVFQGEFPLCGQCGHVHIHRPRQRLAVWTTQPDANPEGGRTVAHDGIKSLHGEGQRGGRAIEEHHAGMDGERGGMKQARPGRALCIQGQAGLIEQACGFPELPREEGEGQVLERFDSPGASVGIGLSFQGGLEGPQVLAQCKPVGVRDEVELPWMQGQRSKDGENEE